MLSEIAFFKFELELFCTLIKVSFGDVRGTSRACVPIDVARMTDAGALCLSPISSLSQASIKHGSSQASTLSNSNSSKSRAFIGDTYWEVFEIKLETSSSLNQAELKLESSFYQASIKLGSRQA